MIPDAAALCLVVVYIFIGDCDQGCTILSPQVVFLKSVSVDPIRLSVCCSLPLLLEKEGAGRAHPDC